MSQPFANNNHCLPFLKSFFLFLSLNTVHICFASTKMNMLKTVVFEKSSIKTTVIYPTKRKGVLKGLVRILIHKFKKTQKWSVAGKVIAGILLLVLLIILVGASVAAGTSTAVLTVIGYAGAALIVFLILRARKRRRDKTRYTGTKEL